MTLSGRRVCVGIPDTALEEQQSFRERTVKLGQVARICSIFGVDLIRLYHDPRGRGESGFMKRVLEYLETPQYLRRRLFALDDSLKYAGLLPPIRIPSHKAKVPISKLHTGEFREGVVLADGRSVDIGLERPLALRQTSGQNKRVTVRVTSTSPLEGVLSDRSQSPEYWGYSVEVCSINDMLADPRFHLKLATSRQGDDLQSSLADLRAKLKPSRSVALIFGAPSRGLFEILGRNLRGRVAMVLNLYPEQHVATVRTEEALASALYLLGLLGAIGDAKV